MMADQPRDWDKELAEIDKLMGKAPAPGRSVPASVPAGPAGPAPAVARPTGGVPSLTGSRRERLGTWTRALAGAVLAAAMTQWPYAHGCGGGLLMYGLAAGAVVVAGVWGASASWRSRTAAAHLLSLVVAGWGVGLLAAILLPRIGYAAVAQTWMCP